MILIGLGSNLPFCGKTPPEIVQAAMHALKSLGELETRSSLYQSDAWPDSSKPPYINAVVSLKETDLNAPQLLLALHTIETAFGRCRDAGMERYSSRTLDLDLLAYGNQQTVAERKSDLVLPHPRIAERDFVLLPLYDITAAWQHPVTGKSTADMLKDLRKTGTRLTARKLPGTD